MTSPTPTTAAGSGPFFSLGRIAFHHRRLIVVVWLVLFAAGIIAVPHLSGVLQGGGITNAHAPSQRAARLMTQRLGQGATSLVVVLQSHSLDATSAAFQSQESRIIASLKQARIPGLSAIQTYATSGAPQLVSKDRRSSAAVLTFNTSTAALQSHIAAIRGALARGARSTELTPYLTGEAAVNADLSKATISDLRKIEVLALPLALIALVIVFGTVVAAALPVLTGVVAVSATLGGIYLLARLTTMSIYCMNVATLLGLAVTIDYALFMVARFREHLHEGSSVEQAVEDATGHAGRSIFFSGAGVAAGLIGLTFFPAPALRSIGIGGALVVLLALAASLTFMPALLAILGRRVDALRVVRQRPPHESRFWTGWTKGLMQRPWLVLAVSLVLVLLIALPALGLKKGSSSAASLPASAPSRTAAELLGREFDQRALSPLFVVVTWGTNGGKTDLATAAQLYGVGQTLAATPGVASVTSPFTLGKLGNPASLAAAWPLFQKLFDDPAAIPNRAITLAPGATITGAELAQIKELVRVSIGPGTALFRVTTTALPTSSAAEHVVGTIANMKLPAGLHVAVAGQAASDRDLLDELNSRLPLIALWIVASSYLILFLLLRSVLLPVLAIAVNWLTILMSWGCLAFVFQRNTFAGLLGFTNTGTIQAILPIITLCLLFGITMDYAVFSLTRMREAWIAGADNRESVGAGLTKSGRIVVSAALLVVIVVGAFAFTSVSVTKMLGIGIALAVVFDTLLVRMSLLPATMVYAGKANWWGVRRASEDGVARERLVASSR